MGDIANKVASIRERLEKADQDSRLSEDEFMDRINGAINTSLGDRVSGQLDRMLKASHQQNQQTAAQLSKALQDLGALLIQSHQANQDAMAALKGDLNAVIGSVKQSIDSQTTAQDIDALREAVQALPRDFPEQRDVDLDPVMDALLAVLQKVSKEAPDLSPRFDELGAMVNRRKKWRLNVVRDQFEDISHIDAEEIT